MSHGIFPEDQWLEAGSRGWEVELEAGAVTEERQKHTITPSPAPGGIKEFKGEVTGLALYFRVFTMMWVCFSVSEAKGVPI